MAKEEKARIDEKTEKQAQNTGGTEKEDEKPEEILEEELPPIRSTIEYVNSAIIGQEEQVKTIVTAVYRKLAMNLKTVVLIVGPTGTGKSETIKQICKKLNILYTIEDSTEFTKSGYYGADVSEIADHLLRMANYDVEIAEQSIVFMDEIDKKVTDVSGDVGGTEVLKSFLSFIDGKKVYTYNDLDTPIVMDTSDLIMVFAGAFEGLEKIREKRLRGNNMGFNSSVTQEGQIKSYTKADFIEFGMPPEFVGRINTIVELNKLSEDILVQILKKSKISPIKIYRKELRRKGVTVSRISDKVYRGIAREAIKSGTGARELSNVVNYVFEDIIFRVLDEPETYSKCVLCEGIELDNTKYKLLP